MKLKLIWDIVEEMKWCDPLLKDGWIEGVCASCVGSPWPLEAATLTAQLLSAPCTNHLSENHFYWSVTLRDIVCHGSKDSSIKFKCFSWRKLYSFHVRLILDQLCIRSSFEIVRTSWCKEKDISELLLLEKEHNCRYWYEHTSLTY